MAKARPTFLGIGAHRAGTSWLYRHLSKHPEIWMSPVKELHYFDRPLRYQARQQLLASSILSKLRGTKNWERPHTLAGLRIAANHLMKGQSRKAVWWGKWALGYYSENWYSDLFLQSVSHKAYGEITPAYSILEKEKVARIKTINPEIKLIFLIRDPIERAWSAIRYNVNRGRPRISINSEDEIISALKTPAVVLRGNYERTLDNYLSYFDSSQLLVCFYDAVKCDPMGLMLGITSFLDLLPYRESDIDNRTRFNASPSREIPDRVRTYLFETYRPMTDRIAERFGSYATLWGGDENPNHARSRKESPTTQLPPVLHP